MNELSWVFGCFATTSAAHKNGQMSYGRGVSIEPKLLIAPLLYVQISYERLLPSELYIQRMLEEGGIYQSIHKCLQVS